MNLSNRSSGFNNRLSNMISNRIVQNLSQNVLKDFCSGEFIAKISQIRQNCVSPSSAVSAPSQAAKTTISTPTQQPKPKSAPTPMIDQTQIKILFTALAQDPSIWHQFGSLGREPLRQRIKAFQMLNFFGSIGYFKSLQRKFPAYTKVDSDELKILAKGIQDYALLNSPQFLSVFPFLLERASKLDMKQVVAQHWAVLSGYIEGGQNGDLSLENISQMPGLKDLGDVLRSIKHIRRILDKQSLKQILDGLNMNSRRAFVRQQETKRLPITKISPIESAEDSSTPTAQSKALDSQINTLNNGIEGVKKELESAKQVVLAQTQALNSDLSQDGNSEATAAAAAKPKAHKLLSQAMDMINQTKSNLLSLSTKAPSNLETESGFPLKRDGLLKMNKSRWALRAPKKDESVDKDKIRIVAKTMFNNQKMKDIKFNKRSELGKVIESFFKQRMNLAGRYGKSNNRFNIGFGNFRRRSRDSQEAEPKLMSSIGTLSALGFK